MKKEKQSFRAMRIYTIVIMTTVLIRGLNIISSKFAIIIISIAFFASMVHYLKNKP